MMKLIPSPYQLIHLTKLRANDQNCLLITDGVGVGKTISSGYVIYQQSRIEKMPVLVVCPPILLDKWRAELSSKFQLESKLANKPETFSLMIDEIENRDKDKFGEIYITSYSILSRVDFRKAPEIGLIVMDEIHTARNPKTKFFPILRTLCESSEFRIGLSATPINNSTNDLAAIQSLLTPRFSYRELSSMLEDLWGLPITDCLSCISTRFTKDDVASHFTSRDIVSVGINYPDLYNEYVRSSIDSRFSPSDGFQLQTVSVHRLAASSPAAFQKSFNAKKMPEFTDTKIERLKEIIESKPDERFLIFTEFRETANYIARNIEDRLILQTSGDSNLEEREANAFLFKESDASIMIMTPVGSEGLDYQFCSNLVNYDLHWNPMKIEQRIGRIDRIGQKKKVVTVYNFHVYGSIDERVRDVIGDKLSLVSGTFADVNSIIEGNQSFSQTQIGDEVVKKETEQADSFVKSMHLLRKTHSMDSEIAKKLESSNCTFSEWNNLDWGAVPWIGEVEDWNNQLKIESDNFSDLMKMYTVKR